ncbi:MAG: molybdate ABC transporter substrate-binding protein, partial [Marinilabiliaceae bacterium]
MQKTVKYIVYLMWFFGGVFSCAPAGEDDQKLTLFVAAGIAEPMERMADEFSKQNEVEVEIHFASSGTLVNQIKRGNNADVYISASKQWMGYACENQLVSSSDVFHIAHTDLVLVGQAGLHFPFSRVSELSSDFDGHIAIGDPDYVPAGWYAVDALRSLEIYEDFREKLL